MISIFHTSRKISYRHDLKTALKRLIQWRIQGTCCRAPCWKKLLTGIN